MLNIYASMNEFTCSVHSVYVYIRFKKLGWLWIKIKVLSYIYINRPVYFQLHVYFPINVLFSNCILYSLICHCTVAQWKQSLSKISICYSFSLNRWRRCMNWYVDMSHSSSYPCSSKARNVCISKYIENVGAKLFINHVNLYTWNNYEKIITIIKVGQSFAISKVNKFLCRLHTAQKYPDWSWSGSRSW